MKTLGALTALALFSFAHGSLASVEPFDFDQLIKVPEISAFSFLGDKQEPQPFLDQPDWHGALIPDFSQSAIEGRRHVFRMPVIFPRKDMDFKGLTLIPKSGIDYKILLKQADLSSGE